MGARNRKGGYNLIIIELLKAIPVTFLFSGVYVANTASYDFAGLGSIVFAIIFAFCLLCRNGKTIPVNNAS